MSTSNDRYGSVDEEKTRQVSVSIPSGSLAGSCHDLEGSILQNVDPKLIERTLGDCKASDGEAFSKLDNSGRMMKPAVEKQFLPVESSDDLSEREEEALAWLNHLQLKRNRRLANKDSFRSKEEASAAFPAVKVNEELNHVQRYTINSPASTSTLPVANQNRLEAPRIELPQFDGNPRHYWKFMQQFQFLVEQRVPDNAQRLMHLINQCTGQAREAISECFGNDPDSDYLLAKEILRDNYGRDQMVTAAIIEDLFKGLKRMHDDEQSLSLLAIRMRNCQLALRQNRREAELDTTANLERIVLTLPDDSRRSWARLAAEKADEGLDVNFSELCEFVKKEARVRRGVFGKFMAPPKVMDRRDIPWENPRRFDGKPQRSRFEGKQFATRGDPKEVECPMCYRLHRLERCELFSRLSVQQRWKVVRKSGVCFVCLGTGHRSENCGIVESCGNSGCRKRHHHTLHYSMTAPPLDTKTSTCGATNREPGGVCLGVIPVRVCGPDKTMVVYALLDNGSDITLIEEDMTRQLGLVGSRTTLNISTVNGSSSIQSRSFAVKVASLDGSEKVEIDSAFSVPKLPIGSVTTPIANYAGKWKHLQGINFDQAADCKIRMLIGADVPDAHIPLECKSGKPKDPYAVRTQLGWILLGPVRRPIENLRRVNNTQTEQSIFSQLKAMYDAEFKDTEERDKSCSVEDKVAIRLVSNSTAWKDGHYQIALPWRKQPVGVRDNKSVAYSRLRMLRRRFLQDEQYFKLYCLTMQNNFDKGYAIPVSKEQLHPDFEPRWYLPHHGVVNPKKPEKLRVVLDCAAKFDNVSLNDRLYQGPDTTANLVGVLLRFRTGAVAVAADVEEMFMQVRVPLRDRGALRFLWWERNDLHTEPKEYQMVAHPFGATSSPFCANYALRQTIQDWGTECIPEVQNAVMRNFYVDDCLSSVADVHIASQFATQLNAVLKKGGFNLRKWIASDPEALNGVDAKDRVSFVKPIDSDSNRNERTLGLEWDSRCDCFQFKLLFPEAANTRRGILSTVSTLFDPLGLVAPVLLPAKIFMQKLCKQRLDWDTPVSQEDLAEWKLWLTTMEGLGTLQIPRYLGLGMSDIEGTQLHVFSDASETGYGVVLYLRCIGRDRIHCSLITSKSRVAPLKTVTIPRMELNAARLAVQTARFVQEEMNLPIDKTTYWTDSTIVLYYIENTTTRYSTFVANRLVTIHELSRPEQWRHVRSEQNPADLVSRGTTSHHAMNQWFRGPDFLWQNECNWPTLERNKMPAVDPEWKVKRVVVNAIVSNSGILRIAEHYSDWTRALKALVWWTRFKMFLRMAVSKNQDLHLRIGLPNIDELRDAEWNLIREVQTQTYPEEMIALSKRSHLKNGHTLEKLKGLNPILQDGLLRVGGRLQYSEYPFSRIHPIILPKTHHVTALIIRHHHLMEGHSGCSQVLAAIRKRYWIVQGYAAVKRVIGACFVCRRLQTPPLQQIMAPIPAARAERGWYPFKLVGIDYFGPMTVKRGRSLEKRYGCLFTCLQTRAVHLEIAHSLTTDSFIMALTRFVARRGSPEEMFSDNGSNFIGAEAELRTALNDLSQKRINDHLLAYSVKWHFNPPLASHRGGIWERVIRSAKLVINSLTWEQHFGDEVLSTLFAEAERILNNRPLVPVKSDVKDLMALSPNDLLLLRANVASVVPKTMSSRYVKRWHQVNYLTELFWRRWVNEYIPTLVVRQKWLLRQRNLRPGDVVLLLNDPLPRERWPLGIVETCEVSDDGVVRGAVVKTKDGNLRRDIRKLCLVEGSE